MYKRKSSDKQIDEVIYKAEHDGFGLNEEELDAYMANYHFGNGANPIGTIIAFMGNTPPIGYLACDGSEYDIIDYPKLAKFFKDEFGSTQYFGGTGDKFKVPDLRGEFLRGTGSNSHANQGSGAAVGTHQDATLFPFARAQGSFISILGSSDASEQSFATNQEGTKKTVTTLQWKHTTVSSTGDTGLSGNVYASRPTNTSVLYCIASKNIYLDARFDYSLEEKVVGEWIDGKTLYQKTLALDNVTGTTAGTFVTISNDISALNISSITDIRGILMLNNLYQTVDYRESNSGGQVKLQASVTSLQLITNLAIDGAKYWVTLQYTKTTDA